MAFLTLSPPENAVGNAFRHVCLSVIFMLKLSKAFGTHLGNILVKFVYEDRRVKVKVTGTKISWEHN